MTAQDLTRSETRLEAKIDKAVSELTWRMLGAWRNGRGRPI